MSRTHRTSRRSVIRGMAILGGVVAATILACSDSTPTTPPVDLSGTFYGNSTTSIEAGSGRAYITLDAAGTPTELGLALTEAALAKMPTTNAEYSFALPSQASVTAYQHAVINWAPTGHEPTPYLVPHLDVHFYMISGQARNAISPADPAYATKLANQPPASFLPAGYVMDMGTQRMGMHWRDAAAPELSGQLFTSTYLYGSYDGKITFVEPMIAKSYLDSKPSLVKRSVKLPQLASTTGYHATAYSTVYDETKHEYRIALVDFVRLVATLP